MSEKVEIYTDGSSLGNPGKGGWGVVIITNGKSEKNNSKIIELGGFEKNTTNNRMELKAVIEALKFLSVSQSLAQAKEIVVHADSSYVLGGVTIWVSNWEKNGWRTSNKKEVLNQDLWKELITLVRSFGTKISWQKVKGHSDVEHNIRADEIATQCSASQESYIK